MGLLEVVVGPVAHGGHCVARHEGRVVFVRHALPGERVLVTVVEGEEDDRFWRADAVEVLEASPDRVTPPCPFAGPGRCGGCDWQHATLPAQRRLKADVVREQLRRLAGLDLAVHVEAVDGPGADVELGLGWRTRVQLAADDSGRLGFRRHRSHELELVDDCLIASPAVRELEVARQRWPGAAGVEVVASAAGEDRLVLATPRPGARIRPGRLPAETSLAVLGPDGVRRERGRTWVAEPVELPGGPRSFRITGSGFWQVHPGAAAALAHAVHEAVRPQAGERALDLYAGAGLFAASLAQAVGESGSVLALEGDRRGAADARRNLHDLRHVTVLHGRVDARLGGALVSAGMQAADVVVLDPPRAGARRPVVEAVAALRPRAVGYVACEPAALARDIAFFAAAGYRLERLRAFDLFPQTAHVECVALLVPSG